MQLNPFSRKYLVGFIAITMGLLLAMALVVVAVSLIYGDKARTLIVNEINKHLLVPVEVGQVDFSVLRSFPDASIVFRNVAIKPSPALKEAPGLLNARSVSLRFSLFSLITGDYKIRSLIIDEASLTIWVGRDGSDNFHIWKQSQGSGSGDVNFDVQRVSLRNTGVYYRNRIKQSDFELQFPDFTMKGRMADEQFDLEVSGPVQLKRLNIGEQNYTPSTAIGLRGIIRVNGKLKRCDVTDVNVKFAGITAAIRGTFGFSGDENPVNLRLSTTDAGISGLLAALPETLAGSLNEYRPGGKLSLETRITGKWGKRNTPNLSATFLVTEGRLSQKGSSSGFHNIILNGRYSSVNGKLAEQFHLDEFSGETRHGRFKGKLGFTDFKKPLLALSLSADLDLAELNGLLKKDELEDMQGRLVADFQYRGALKPGEQMAVSSGGRVKFSNAGFKLVKSGTQVGNLNGSLEFKNKRVFADGLEAVVGESDFRLNGYSENLLGYLFSADQPLSFEANITSDNFRLEDLLPFSSEQADSAGAEAVFPERLSFNSTFTIGQFSFRKFTASGISGDVTLNDQVLRANNLSFAALDGNVKASGVLNGRYGDHAQVVCNASLNNVDIKRLFAEFNDFGQTNLQSRHIRGRADATVQYASRLNTKFETDEASVAAVADVEIRNGELLKFEPLQELSRFLDEDELMNVKFSTLRNRIEIANKTVVIPEMEVQTSAINLKGYGSHTFGNDIDYHFSVLTSEIRKSKRRKNPPPPTAVEDDGLGHSRLFLHMTGTVDEPVVSYDHQAVARKIAGDFKKEKQELRDAIRREFSPGKVSPDQKPAKTSTQFEIEWDEDK